MDDTPKTPPKSGDFNVDPVRGGQNTPTQKNNFEGKNYFSPTPNGVDDQLKKIEDSINAASLPLDLHDKVVAMLNRLKLIKNDTGFFMEYDSISRYIEWIVNLPWNKASQDILDLTHARQVLDSTHYGLSEVKEKIEEYLSIMILKNRRGLNTQEQFARAPIISLVGLVGVGKTTISYSIADALGRKIERIPFGGMGSPAQLRGKTRLFPDAEPGLVIKALRRAGTNNPVLLFDEIDRVSSEARSDIMGVLVELLDPLQNKAFTDHFIDYPVDLSNVLFIVTSNNTKDISTAVIDRLEIIQMPSYTDQEKIIIAKSYMFPKILKESGMSEKDLVIDENVWDLVVRPLGYDPGIRGLERNLQGLVRKVVYYMLQGKIPGNQTFHLTAQNIKDFVPQW